MPFIIDGKHVETYECRHDKRNAYRLYPYQCVACLCGFQLRHAIFASQHCYSNGHRNGQNDNDKKVDKQSRIDSIKYYSADSP